MKIKKLFSGILVYVMLISVFPQQANAAGAMRFDYENSGVEQVYEYAQNYDNDEWEWVSCASYEYYPDGTVKTVYSNHSGWDYEGHYDPHGHLMDPSIIRYIGEGYTEGIALDPDAKPIQEYDSEGRLTHFEALHNNAYDSFTVKIDYEYDDQNRISRVYYKYDIPKDSDKYDSIVAVSPICSIFDYSDDGTYRRISVLALPEEGYTYRQSFSYDAGHRLVCKEESKDGIYFDGEREYYRLKEVYAYDEDGFLTLYQRYDGYSDEFDEAAELTEECKYDYHRVDKRTLICDVSVRWEDSEEYENSNTITFVFDEAGRVIEDYWGQYRYDLKDTDKR